MRNSLAPVKLIGGICMRSLPSGQEPFVYGSKMGGGTLCLPYWYVIMRDIFGPGGLSRAEGV